MKPFGGIQVIICGDFLQVIQVFILASPRYEGRRAILCFSIKSVA
jgi:hypothetical protein